MSTPLFMPPASDTPQKEAVTTFEAFFEPETIEQPFLQEWILLDSYSFEVIACQSNREHVFPGSVLTDHDPTLAKKAQHILRQLNTGFLHPILLMHNHLFWYLIPQFYLSTGCCLLARLQVPPRVLYAFAESGEMGTVFMADNVKKPEKPLDASVEDAYVAVHNWWFSIHACLPRQGIMYRSYYDFLGEILRLMQALSQIAGAAVEIVRTHEPVDIFPLPSSFDLNMFAFYTLVIFRLFRRFGKGTKISACIDTTSENLCIRYSFVTAERAGFNTATVSPEIRQCMALAARYEQVFSCNVSDSLFTVRFCPNRKEYSVLGVKAEAKLRWR